MITKKKEALTESQPYTCPNPSCGKAFTNPIKAENLGLQNSDAYYACPYCLSEITVEKSGTIVEEKQKIEVKKIKSEHAKTKPKDESGVQPSNKMQGCLHHFGYLSKRSEKEKIPDECIICENIVECMLKNVTS